jgi:hypothetical protein
MMARGRGNDNNHNDSILGLVYAHGFIDTLRVPWPPERVACRKTPFQVVPI